MRRCVTILFIWLLGALGLPAPRAWADTIHLKNGRTIVADHVREDGNHYQYDVGDDSYAIQKALVDHIDTGGMPAQASAGAAKVG